jgi:hypothetical protein
MAGAISQVQTDRQLVILDAWPQSQSNTKLRQTITPVFVSVGSRQREDARSNGQFPRVNLRVQSVTSAGNQQMRRSTRR